MAGTYGSSTKAEDNFALSQEVDINGLSEVGIFDMRHKIDCLRFKLITNNKAAFHVISSKRELKIGS